MLITTHIKSHNPTIFTLIDTSHKQTTSNLQWITQHIHPRPLQHKKPTPLSHLLNCSDFEYTVHGTTPPTNAPQQGRGILVFVHHSWKRRLIQSSIDPLERWIVLSFRTTHRTLSIISFYGHPAGTGATAQKYRADLQTNIYDLQAKNHDIILLTDFNLTRYEHPDTTPHKQQTKLFNQFTIETQLMDSVTPPSIQPYTFQRGAYQSSPDHILISSQLLPHITNTTIDHSTITNSLSDHALLLIELNINPIHHIYTKPVGKIKIPCTEEAKQNYAIETRQTLKKLHNPSIKTILQTIYHTAQKLHPPPPNLPNKPLKTHKLICKLQRLLQSKRHNPNNEHTRQQITTTRRQIKKLVREQNNARQRLFYKRRITLFDQKKFGKFLNNALGRNTDFQGIEGIRTHEGILTDSPSVCKQATTKIKQIFYTNRLPAPQYFVDYDDQYWHLLPVWLQNIFAEGRHPRETNIFSSVTSPATLEELRTILQSRPSNKSPGPTGVTYEMLRYLADETIQEYLLPTINKVLTEGCTDNILKTFHVWCTEKSQGVGSILNIEGKPNVRPISLYETLTKIIETIITQRLYPILQVNNILHPSQHGFIPGKSVEETLLLYVFLFEDAKMFKKELHISANDCSLAYDSVPHWAMKLIYRQHGFSEHLIRILLSLDTHRTGRVLTAHGPGHTFNSTGGLGQGSAIAPLKWNLFLNTLLKWQQTAPDPYTLQHCKIPLSGVAFADDSSWISSTHKGYLERMRRGKLYFKFFGVDYSPTKTIYTYVNQPKGTHYKAIPLYDHTTNTNIPTQVVSPHEAIRFLGGWIDPTLRYNKARTHLKSELEGLLQIIKRKKLTNSQTHYILQAVIQAKAKYYLTVVPLTDEDLKSLDQKISTIWRARTGLVRSCSPELGFLTKENQGYEYPSFLHVSRLQLITQAHNLLNSSSFIGKIARSRLQATSMYYGLTDSLLHTKYPSTDQDKWWFMRVHHALQSISLTLPDLHGHLSTHSNRKVDIPLYKILINTPQQYILKHLTKNNQYFLGDITDATGKYLALHATLHNQKWYKALKTILCPHDTNTLEHHISPRKQYFVGQPIHLKKGDLIFIPPHGNGKSTYGIVKTYKKDGDGHPIITYRKLKPVRSLYLIKGEEFTQLKGRIFIPKRGIIEEEFLNSCYKLEDTNILIKHKHFNNWTKAHLILHSDYIETTTNTYRGKSTHKQLLNYTQHMSSHLYQDEQGYYYSDEDISHATV